jgi:hypothetical protein
MSYYCLIFFVIFAEDTKFGYLGWILVRSTTRIPYPVHRLFLCVPVVLVYAAALLPAPFIFFALLFYYTCWFFFPARSTGLPASPTSRRHRRTGSRGRAALAAASVPCTQQTSQRSSGRRRQQVRPPSAPRPGQWRSRLPP